MKTSEFEQIRAAIEQELEYALRTHGKFTSTHEAYGVLAEEMYEVLLALHQNDKRAMRSELIQVVVVAMKGILYIQKELSNEQDN